MGGSVPRLGVFALIAGRHSPDGGNPDRPAAVGDHFRMIAVAREAFREGSRGLTPFASSHGPDSEAPLAPQRDAEVAVAEPVAVVLAPVDAAFFPGDPEASARIK